MEFAELDYLEDNYIPEEHVDDGLMNRRGINDSDVEDELPQAAPISAINFKEPVVLKTGRTTYKRIRDNVAAQNKGLLTPFRTKRDFDLFHFIHKSGLTRDEFGELFKIDFVCHLSGSIES